MEDLLDCSIEELRTYKQYLISLIKDKTTPLITVKSLQRRTRAIDKRIKSLLIEQKKENKINE